MKKELTIKDLLIKGGCFCVGVPISKDCHLFIEGLSDNGEAITSDFDISLVKNVIVKVIDTLDVKLSTKVQHVLNIADKIIQERKKHNEKL